MSIFGTSDESFKKAAGKTFSDIVEEWANKISLDLRKALRDSVSLYTSGKLEQSIVTTPVKVEGKKFTAEIKAADYWKYVNEGVQGVGGNMADGRQWVRKNTTSPFSFKKANKPSVKHFIQWSNLASRSPFAVRETVFHSGTKGKFFFEDVVNESLEKELAAELKKIMTKTIEIDIKTDYDGK
jgi:hypothetical protein